MTKITNRIRHLNRIKEIEERWDTSIEELLYQMHWGEDMMHREIGEILGLPRPTITRWFTQLGISTQSCHRFTDKNLTSWLYKTGSLQKKPRYEGPDRRIQRTKGNLNVDFFKSWSPDMAYVLGYFAADGGMFVNSGGSKYIHFVSTDYELLKKVKKILQSKHRITLKKKIDDRRKDVFQLQIGSKEMYNDLLRLGFTPKKDRTLKLPIVPKSYFRHFVRGYFDGDGCITYGWYKRRARNNKKYLYFKLGFTCGSSEFLKDLSNRISINSKIGIGNGSISGWQLSYCKKDALKLFVYMYAGVTSDKYLWRKYSKFQEAFANSRGRGLAGLRR